MNDDRGFTDTRFHERNAHHKLLRFVTIRIIDLCVDVEKTAYCVHVFLSAVHQSHAYVFGSALSGH